MTKQKVFPRKFKASRRVGKLSAIAMKVVREVLLNYIKKSKASRERSKQKKIRASKVGVRQEPLKSGVINPVFSVPIKQPAENANEAKLVEARQSLLKALEDKPASVQLVSAASQLALPAPGPSIKEARQYGVPYKNKAGDEVIKIKVEDANKVLKEMQEGKEERDKLEREAKARELADASNKIDQFHKKIADTVSNPALVKFFNDHVDTFGRVKTDEHGTPQKPKKAKVTAGRNVLLNIIYEHPTMLQSITEDLYPTYIEEPNNLTSPMIINSLNAAYAKMGGTGGIGASSSSGALFNTQIEEMMQGKGDFLGVYSVDQFKKVPKQKDEWKFSIIANTMPSTTLMGHWVAIKVGEAGDGKPTVEYYDPLAEPPKPDMMRAIRRLVKRMGVPTPLQFKVNKIQDQSTTSANCGWFAMKFLTDRYEGKPFREASSFNAVVGEKNIKEYKKHYKKFGRL